MLYIYFYFFVSIRFFIPLKLSDDIKADKFLFLDTNVFIHCKDFSKISWKRLFNDNTQKIILVIPETVLDELDDLKHQIGKIKKVISNIRKYRGTNFQKGVELRLSHIPPNWEKLKLEIRKRLKPDKNDHLIITEILNFMEKNQGDVYFITGDNAPEIKASDLGIKTIFWRDDK